MKGKNVVFICDYAPNYSGNFIASLRALSQKLIKNNDVYFVFPEVTRDRAWLNYLPVEKRRISFCSFSPRSLAMECKRLSAVLNNKPVVVHTHFVADWNLMAVRMVFSNVICHYHMPVPVVSTWMQKIKRLVRCFIYHNLIVVGVSEAVTDDLKKYLYHFFNEVIPNAIDFAMLDKCSADSVLPANLFGRESFRILIHGTDFFGKGVDLAAKAVECLNKSKPNQYGLYITSNNAASTENYLREICGEIDNIKVIHPVEYIKCIYDSVDLFISPSREEAFGYAVVEAAYSDCQVLASDVPGQNTMKSIPGILWIEKDDVSGLMDAIQQAEENKRNGFASKMKDEQRRVAVANFHIDSWVQQNLSLYRKYFGNKNAD